MEARTQAFPVVPAGVMMAVSGTILATMLAHVYSLEQAFFLIQREAFQVRLGLFGGFAVGLWGVGSGYARWPRPVRALPYVAFGAHVVGGMLLYASSVSVALLILGGLAMGLGNGLLWGTVLCSLYPRVVGQPLRNHFLVFSGFALGAAAGALIYHQWADGALGVALWAAVAVVVAAYAYVLLRYPLAAPMPTVGRPAGAQARWGTGITWACMALVALALETMPLPWMADAQLSAGLPIPLALAGGLGLVGLVRMGIARASMSRQQPLLALPLVGVGLAGVSLLALSLSTAAWIVLPSALLFYLGLGLLVPSIIAQAMDALASPARFCAVSGLALLLTGSVLLPTLDDVDNTYTHMHIPAGQTLTMFEFALALFPEYMLKTDDEGRRRVQIAQQALEEVALSYQQHGVLPPSTPDALRALRDSGMTVEVIDIIGGVLGKAEGFGRRAVFRVLSALPAALLVLLILGVWQRRRSSA